MSTVNVDVDAAGEREDFADLMLDSAAGAFRAFGAYLGVRLGYYDALARGDALTPVELASATGTHERYAREWLEQQTVADVLRVEDARAPAPERRYRLPRGHAECLTDRDSLDYLAPLVRLLAGAVRPLDAVVDAYRTGAGVPFEAYGPDLREGQGAMNRAMFLQLLGPEWIPQGLPDVHERLSTNGARVADVGCGVGWSSIGVAKAYPGVRVDGVDVDEPSVEIARRNAKDAQVEDRVRFHARDAADPAVGKDFDLVMALECVHDMSRPVDVLRAMRELAAPDGAVLVVDENVGESFTPEGQGLEWMMYGWSILHCLPVGLAEQPSAGTGAVLRPPMLAEYARDAGFSRTEVLDVQNPFLRLYRLHG